MLTPPNINRGMVNFDMKLETANNDAEPPNNITKAGNQQQAPPINTADKPDNSANLGLIFILIYNCLVSKVCQSHRSPQIIQKLIS